jgi:peroxiredoxin
MLVEDGNIVKIFSEPGKQDECPSDPFEVSDSNTMLKYIRERETTRAA